MLFPPAGDAGPASSWPSSRTAAAGRAGPAWEPRPGGTSRPHRRERARHAAARRARPRPVHPSAPARAPVGNGAARTGVDWSTRFVTEDALGRRRPADPHRRRRGRRARAWSPRSRRSPAGRCGLRHTLTNTAPGTYVLDGPGGRAAGRRPPHRGARLHRPARARAQPAAAPRHRRAVAARGPRRPARARRRDDGRARHRRLLHDPRRGARRARRVERQLGAARRARRRPPARPSVAASSCCPARWPSRRGRRTRRRGCSSPRPTTGSTASPRRGTPGSARCRRAPERAAGRAERLGGGLLRPRPRPAARASPTGRRASAWSCSSSTTAGSAHRRDDTGGLGDWWVDETVWPAEQGGLSPLVEHVRGLGMEFGLWFEPEMVNPDSDLYREHPDWVLATGDRVPLLRALPAGARPDPARGLASTSSSGWTPCCRRTRSTT